MKKTYLIIMLGAILSGCGSKNSFSEMIVEPLVTADSLPALNVDNIDIDPSDIGTLPKLKPTTYYIAKEDDTNCKGRYREATYNGREVTNLKDLNGDTLASVCTRFYRTLLMEGTAVLSDRGQGEVTLNYAGRVDGVYRFKKMDKCVFGEGVQKDLCLIPFRTLAADQKAYRPGDVVFVPKAVDLLLPDGTFHDGFFLVRDTGGAFTGKGFERVDMFTGYQPDHDNVFLDAGFNRENPMDAYLIKGDSAKLITERFKVQFPDIF